MLSTDGREADEWKTLRISMFLRSCWSHRTKVTR